MLCAPDVICARQERAVSRYRLTAMSGLSAKTSSCGGEGSRLGLGGDSFGGGKADFVAALLLAKMGKSFWISFSSCSDRSLLSESDMVVAWWMGGVEGVHGDVASLRGEVEEERGPARIQ